MYEFFVFYTCSRTETALSSSKECIHFNACGNIVDRYCNGEDIYNYMEAECKHFKDKSKIIELPCKVGDTVYFFRTAPSLKKSVAKLRVEEICYNGESFCIGGFTDHFVYLDLQVTEIFHTKEEAEKALEGWENGD